MYQPSKLDLRVNNLNYSAFFFLWHVNSCGMHDRHIDLPASDFVLGQLCVSENIREQNIMEVVYLLTCNLRTRKWDNCKFTNSLLTEDRLVYSDKLHQTAKAGFEKCVITTYVLLFPGLP